MQDIAESMKLLPKARIVVIIQNHTQSKTANKRTYESSVAINPKGHKHRAAQRGSERNTEIASNIYIEPGPGQESNVILYQIISTRLPSFFFCEAYLGISRFENQYAWDTTIRQFCVLLFSDLVKLSGRTNIYRIIWKRAY